MSDLDRIASGLRRDVGHRPWPEPDDIRARGARRNTRQVLAGTAATIAVLVAGSAGMLAVTHRSGQPAAPGAPSTSFQPSTPPQSSVGEPSIVEPSGTGAAPLPAGSTVDDLTFVSPTAGWLLAARQCPAGTCAAIVHTTDGGHTWTALPAPPADVPAAGAHIRFANVQTGYLYSPTVLYLTRDGGASWTKQAGHADALEVANGTALRIAGTSAQCAPGCSYQIQRAPTAGAQWTTVATPANIAAGAQLLRTGRRAFAALYRNPAGGVSAHADLLTSADDGATWTAGPDPCGTSQGVESVSVRMAVAEDGSMTMLCYVRGGTGSTFLVTSTDGGASFGPQRPTPGPGMAVGAASARTLFVSVLDGSTIHLYRSDDAGATWVVAATAPDRVTQGEVPDGEIGFQTGREGWWLPGRGTAFATTDSGRTWTGYRLSP
jgi:photosystem II stability/assembly factor-like uncharacterized protein